MGRLARYTLFHPFLTLILISIVTVTLDILFIPEDIATAGGFVILVGLIQLTIFIIYSVWGWLDNLKQYDKHKKEIGWFNKLLYIFPFYGRIVNIALDKKK